MDVHTNKTGGANYPRITAGKHTQLHMTLQTCVHD